MGVVNYGLYKVKDEYFIRFKNKYFSDNKSENRPYYFSFMDKDGIIWFIPLSSQVDNYRQKINKTIADKGKCLFYFIDKIHGEDRVFLIGNMFPITENYISGEYTYSNVHYVVKNTKTIKEISKRAKKFLSLVKYGKLKPNINILEIKDELLNTMALPV